MSIEAERDDGTDVLTAVQPAELDDPAVRSLLQGFMNDVRKVPRPRIACIKSNPASDTRTDAQREQDLQALQDRIDRGEI